MNYKFRRRLYSHNFLYNPKLVAKLIRNSSIDKNDTVLEIGPGRGIITGELLKHSKKVIAIELDYNLYCFLKRKYSGLSNLELNNSDFLNFLLPNQPYKIFSNIPFRLTSQIINKLVNDNYFQEGYLIVQKEAAKRFIGKPFDCKNSMLSTLIKPWFEIGVYWNFRRFDFIPKPNVNVVMIKITRRRILPVSGKNRILYRDYVIYSYNRQKIASLNFEKLLNRFYYYLKHASNYQKKIVAIKSHKILHDQKTLPKIHRTRNDKGWRKF